MKKQKKPGRPPIKNRDIVTGTKNTTAISVFKKTSKVCNRMYINSNIPNKPLFFDYLVCFVCENQEEFAKYLEGK